MILTKKHIALFLIFLLSLVVINGCSIEVSKTKFYQEPLRSENNAVIKLKNKSFASGLIGDIIKQPKNTLNFYEMDGRRIAFAGDELQVTPGKHHLIISCNTNNRMVGLAAISFNALPNHLYQIALPEELYGYNIDYKACKRLRFY